jgi:hypothetical protein
MKSIHLVILIIAFSFLLFGCPEIPPTGLPLEQIGTINSEDSIVFVDKLPIGTSMQDSISILYYDRCYDKSYFRVEKIEEFTFRFTLIDRLVSEICFNSPIIKSKVQFSFTPTKKGTYTLLIEDKQQKYVKSLVVE